MAKAQQKIIAIRLRQDGTSISDIARRLQVSKSTVSHWCRDIILTPSARAKIVHTSKRKSTENLLTYTESLRQLRQDRIKQDLVEGKNLLQTLSTRDIFCIGLGLYWGEGYKKGNQEFGFTNSDPKMVTFYIKWLGTVFGVLKEDLILRVSVNALHTARVREIERHWAKITCIPLTQFTKPSLIRTVSKKVYDMETKHYGTLRIKVRRGTRLRCQILGAIEAISFQE